MTSNISPALSLPALMSLTLALLTLAPRGCICLYPVSRWNRWRLHRELYYPPTHSYPVIDTLTGVPDALLMPPMNFRVRNLLAVSLNLSAVYLVMLKTRPFWTNSLNGCAVLVCGISTQNLTNQLQCSLTRS